MNLKKIIKKAVNPVTALKVGMSLSPIGQAKSVIAALKTKDNNVTPAVVSSNVGVSVAKSDIFSPNVVTLPAISAVNIQPTAEQGGGIVGGGINGGGPGEFSSTGSSGIEAGYSDDFVEDTKPTDTQKKVSGWLGNWLPSLETNVNFPDRKPIYVIGAIGLLLLLIHKFIKKRK